MKFLSKGLKNLELKKSLGGIMEGRYSDKVRENAGRFPGTSIE